MIRNYKKEDSGAVKELILSILSKEYPFDRDAYVDSDINDITGTYSGDRNKFFVVQEGQKIIGTAGVKGESPKTALLRRFYIQPESRDKAIGGSLLNTIISYCRDNGYCEIVFRATDRMKSTIALIKKHGFMEKEKLEVSGFHIHTYLLKL